MTDTPTTAPVWFTDAVGTKPRLETVAVDGADVAYRVWDDAGDEPRPGILLVHGGAAHAGWWDHLAPQLVADGYRVAAFDLSGHGDSDWREDHYTYRGWATELVEVAKAAGIADDLVVIGHSMGGIVSMFASVEYPDVVDRVVIVDSELFDADDIKRMMTHGAPVDTAIPRKSRHYASREEALGRYRLLPDQETLPYVRDYVARGSVTSDDDGWRWKFDRSFPTRLTDPAPTPPPGCRLTIIRGEHGVMDPVKAKALFESRPAGTSSLVTMPDTGHHVMLDRPLELLAELRTALGDSD
ncbi:alpha/beta fold hydrolase [Gordonia sp. (in: high G+C Gram-positive bacteria)]|uniref:alpha/beta fold hydrolase n=1 Tax=Gordonia sp. (in: high G+C Gram-positive bacteria) TaxID=84139 RepID=UPI0039E56E1C